MVRVVLHGCNGRMGMKLTELIKESSDLEVVAGVDVSGEQKSGYPVYKNLNDIREEFDVIIDFSTAKAMDGLLSFVEREKKALVLCSTGLSEEQIERVNEISKETPILRSANMSLGINILSKIVSSVTEVLFKSDFDIEIIEKHHKMKLDAPSGTAILLADVIKEALHSDVSYNLNRSEVRKAREKNEIGIQAVRGGSIVGEHDVIFAGEDEVITLSHTAYSRAVFAKGAMSAASYLAGKPAGLYSLKDVIG